MAGGRLTESQPVTTGTARLGRARTVDALDRAQPRGGGCGRQMRGARKATAGATAFAHRSVAMGRGAIAGTVGGTGRSGLRLASSSQMPQ